MAGSTAQTVIIISAILSKKRKELHIIQPCCDRLTKYMMTAPGNYEISEFLPLAFIEMQDN